MVKVKFLDIVNSRDPLVSLMNQKMPMALSYKFSKIFKEVASELDLLEQQRQKMIRELGEPIDGEESGSWRVKKENEKEFQRQFEELLNEELNLNFEPIPISTFETLNEKISFSPIELSKFSFIFN